MSSPANHGRSGRPWRRIREQVLARDPYCTIRGPKCRGISTQVDHVIPLSVAPELAHDLDNLRGACASCNARGGARITNSRGTYRQPAPATRSVRDQPCNYTPGDRLPCQVSCGGSIAPHACRLPDSFWNRT